MKTNLKLIFILCLQPGESGFVLLENLTVETSTDPDDSWTLGPPSPCDVEFKNDNVIIDGKSCIRDKTKEQKVSFAKIIIYRIIFSSGPYFSFKKLRNKRT